MEKIDCSQCKNKDCCSIIGFPKDFANERKYLAEKKMIDRAVETKDEIFFLTKDSKCAFLDRLTGRCRIYDSRPKICRDFGYEPLLQCPYFKSDGTKRSFQERKITEMMIGKFVDETMAKIGVKI